MKSRTKTIVIISQTAMILIAFGMIIFSDSTADKFRDKQIEMAKRYNELAAMTKNDDIRMDRLNNTYRTFDLMDDSLNGKHPNEDINAQMIDIATEFIALRNKNANAKTEMQYLAFTHRINDSILNPKDPVIPKPKPVVKPVVEDTVETNDVK